MSHRSDSEESQSATGFSRLGLDEAIVTDPSELEDARWFSIDALPDLPEPVHISRLLIDDKLQKIEDMLRSVAVAAKEDWDIGLG